MRLLMEKYTGPMLRLLAVNDSMNAVARGTVMASIGVIRSSPEISVFSSVTYFLYVCIYSLLGFLVDK